MEEVALQLEKELTIEAELNYFKTSCEFKDKLFSIIGHDLRGPLSSIKGFLMLLEDEQLSDGQRKAFSETLRHGVDASLETLDNLLGWASQKYYGTILNVKTKEETINLHNLVSHVIGFVRHHSAKKDIALVNNTLSGINVKADLQQLTFVLRNIVSNAIKFSYQGGKVIIECNLVDEMVEIAVIDDGMGMSRQDIDALFQIDKRLSRKGTDDEQGTGLGLIFCKEFIENTGGNIWAGSDGKKGTTFRFTVKKADQTNS